MPLSKKKKKKKKKKMGHCHTCADVHSCITHMLLLKILSLTQTTTLRRLRHVTPPSRTIQTAMPTAMRHGCPISHELATADRPHCLDGWLEVPNLNIQPSSHSTSQQLCLGSFICTAAAYPGAEHRHHHLWVGLRIKSETFPSVQLPCCTTIIIEPLAPLLKSS
jgi:hypothetical protein